MNSICLKNSTVPKHQKHQSNLEEVWKRKRRFTVLIYALTYFLNGIERSANTATLWIYLTTLIKTSNYNIAYSLINVAIYIAPIFFSAAIAKYVDRTRNSKLAITLIMVLALLGSLLYILPYSIWLPFFGKFFNGFSLCIRPIVVGETARTYDKETIQSKLPIYSLSSGLGFALGPIMTALCINVNFVLGNLVINYGNVSGFIIFVLTLIILIMQVIFSCDLSREHDAYTCIQNGDKTTCLIKLKTCQPYNQDNYETWKIVLRQLIKTPVMVILFCYTFHTSISSVALFRLLPIIIIEKLNYEYIFINLWYCIHAVLCIIVLAVYIKVKVNTTKLIRFGFLGLFSLTLSLTILIMLHVTNYKNNSLSMMLLGIFVFSYTGTELGEHAFTVVVVAKLVNMNKQCYIESLRTMVLLTGSLIGAFLSGYIMVYPILFCLLFIFVTIVLGLGLLWKRNVLSNPEVII